MLAMRTKRYIWNFVKIAFWSNKNKNKGKTFD